MYLSVRVIFSLVAESESYSSLQCTDSPDGGLSVAEDGCGAWVVVHGVSWPLACGIFLDQGLNPRSLH